MEKKRPRAGQAADRRFVYLLNVAQRRLQRWSESQREGGTAAQAGVLFSLSPRGGVLIGDVAKTLGVGPSGISGLVDRMELAGLLLRVADAKDGRSIRLVLTESGLSAREAAKARAAAMNARLVQDFSDRELDVVARWLSHVDRSFKSEDD